MIRHFSVDVFVQNYFDRHNISFILRSQYVMKFSCEWIVRQAREIDMSAVDVANAVSAFERKLKKIEREREGERENDVGSQMNGHIIDAIYVQQQLKIYTVRCMSHSQNDNAQCIMKNMSISL